MRQVAVFSWCVVLLTLCFSLPTVAQEHVWPGWRGVTQEGRSATPDGPLHWSTTEHVRWKTAIPGIGHSSPILTKDTIYLTSAKATPNRWISSSKLALLGLLLVLFVLSYRTIVQAMAQVIRQPLPPRRLAGIIGFLLLLLVLVALVLFGERFLNFTREPARGWIGLALVGSLALFSGGLFAPARTKTPYLFGGLLALFAVLLFVMVPDRNFAFAGGLGNMGAAFNYLIIALPVWLGGVLFTLPLSQRHTAEATGPDTGAIIRWLIGGIAGLALVGLIFLVLNQRGDVMMLVSTPKLYVPHQPLWALLVLGGLCAGAFCWRKSAARSLGAHLAFTVTLALLLASVAGVVYEQTLAHSPFISYIMASPPQRPMFGWASLGVFLGVGLLSLVVFTLVTRRREPAPAFLPVGYRVLAVLITVLYALNTVVLPSKPQTARLIVAVDRQSGQVKWVREVARGPQEHIHRDNSEATPTPVTDGKRVYAYFGSAGVVGIDANGTVLWKNTAFPFRTRMGPASSLVLAKDRLILLSESDVGRNLVAFDTATGTVRWQTPRRKRIHNYAGNCRTPVVASVRGQEQIIVWGYEDFSGYDPQTGKELWTYQVGHFGRGTNPVCTMISDAQAFYLLGPQMAYKIDRAKLGTGADPFIWQTKLKFGPQSSSPVLVNGLLFSVSDGAMEDGFIDCLDAQTGKLVWEQHIGRRNFRYSGPKRNHYPSLTAIGERIYTTDTGGMTLVFPATRNFRVLAKNDVHERVLASLTPVDGAMYLRTSRNLYCIAEQ